MHTLYIGTKEEYAGRGDAKIQAGIFCKVEYTPSEEEKKEANGARAYLKKHAGTGKLSISGVIGPRTNGDAYGSCGQIDNTIREAFEAGEITLAKEWTPEMLTRFLEVWDAWHLNDMRPECEHQRALGWREKAREMRTMYHWRLLPEISAKQKELQAEAIDRAASTESTALGFSPEEKRILKLEYALTTTAPDLTGYDLKYYGKPSPGITAHEETKARGWLNAEEHPDGLLSKACPVCAYKYGTAWKTAPVPADVLKFLNELPAASRVPAWI